MTPDPAASREPTAGQSTADRVELVLHPAGRSVIVLAFGWLIIPTFILIACLVMLSTSLATDHRGSLFFTPIILFLVILAVAGIVRNCMRYELTNLRVRARRGVISRTSTEARLADLQSVTIERTALQRVLALGTIRLTTAGVGPDVVWGHIAQTDSIADRLRRAIDRAHAGDRRPEARTQSSIRPIQAPVSGPPSSPSSSIARMPVVGLAGGIGAGKSTVAKAFERIGCFVIDSDMRARAALDRPDVRTALVAWWGPEILGSEGRVDRSKVASIIFSDPAQRSRLERLVHPIVREDRAAMIKEARSAGAKAVIVDAPLLFEAGVDADCDEVVFVDAPRDQRLARVKQTRGWDESELARREASQMLLDEKRRRCRFVVENHGNMVELDAQVSTILAQVTSAG